MPYIATFVLLGVGLVLLVGLLIRSVTGLRRFNRTANTVLAGTGEKVSMVRARAAAVRVLLAQRRSLKAPGGEP